MNTQNFPLLSYRTITGRELENLKYSIRNVPNSEIPDLERRDSSELILAQEIRINNKRIGILHNCYDLIHLSPNGKWSLQMDLNKNHGTTFKSFRSLKDLKENLERNIGYILDDWEDLL